MNNKIILNQKIVSNDWQHLGDEDPIADGNLIVTMARWNSDRDALLAQSGQLGIKLNGDDPLEAILDDLEHFALIALDFPAFPDGRCYSYARLLRDRHAYKGELRAVGDVLLDQVFNYYRCGINALEMRVDQDLETALKHFKDFTVKYQTGVDEPLPIYRRRQAA